MNNKQDFEARLNTEFELSVADWGLTLTLIAVDSIKADTTKDGQNQPFSAVFEADAGEPIEQGTYTLLHPDVGEIVLFIVPIGPAEAGMRYEAVFT